MTMSKLPTKKHIKEVISVMMEDCGWVIGSTIDDLASYIRSELKTFSESAYEDGFYDGQLENQGECECDCKYCKKCTDK